MGNEALPEPAGPKSMSGPQEPSDEPIDAATRARFEQDLRARGEVAADGEELPPGATHQVQKVDGEERIVRRRFSAS